MFKAKISSLIYHCSLISLVSLIFLGCETRDKIRVYEEVYQPPQWTSTPTTAAMPMTGVMPQDKIHAMFQGMPNADVSSEILNSVSPQKLNWKTPEGWTQKSGGGLRVASFTDVAGKIDVSIVQLQGEAGGIEANLIRWAAQAGISVDPKEIAEKLISKVQIFNTQSGLPGKMYDYRTFKTEGNTIVASVIESPGMVIFVKMVGPQADIENNLKLFNDLNQSIALHE